MIASLKNFVCWWIVGIFYPNHIRRRKKKLITISHLIWSNSKTNTLISIRFRHLFQQFLLMYFLDHMMYLKITSKLLIKHIGKCGAWRLCRNHAHSWLVGILLKSLLLDFLLRLIDRVRWWLQIKIINITHINSQVSFVKVLWTILRSFYCLIFLIWLLRNDKVFIHKVINDQIADIHFLFRWNLHVKWLTWNCDNRLQLFLFS